MNVNPIPSSTSTGPASAPVEGTDPRTEEGLGEDAAAFAARLGGEKSTPRNSGTGAPHVKPEVTQEGGAENKPGPAHKQFHATNSGQTPGGKSESTTDLPATPGLLMKEGGPAPSGGAGSRPSVGGGGNSPTASRADGVPGHAPASQPTRPDAGSPGAPPVVPENATSSEEPSPATPPSAGDAILAGLFGGGQVRTEAGNPVMAQSPIEAAPTQKSEPTTQIAQIASAIADRILVSDASLTDQRMISIQLKDDILPRTEIRVSFEGGQLKVEMQTGSADSFFFLNNQRDGLVRHLQSTLPDQPVNVTVAMEGSSTGADSDGRSRNQRDLASELLNGEDA